MIATRPLEPFGAGILGVSITDPPAGIDGAIVEAVSRHRVVVFRSQVGASVDLVRFLRTMGELMFTIGETPVAGAPELNVVSNVGGIRPSRSVFHTDTS
jgi:taurine dioxygenase